MIKTLTWNEFIYSAKIFINLSDKLNDSWSLVEKNIDEGNSYLVYNQKLKCNLNKSSMECETDDLVENIDIEDGAYCSNNKSEELINMEYHVVYSISYQVPIIYFRGYKSGGTLISLEDSWRIFNDSTNPKHIKSGMLTILTQMEHPVLFKPFLALHPCKTAEILANSPKSKNFLVTFISVMGPFIQLTLNSNYSLEIEK